MPSVRRKECNPKKTTTVVNILHVRGTPQLQDPTPGFGRDLVCAAAQVTLCVR